MLFIIQPPLRLFASFSVLTTTTSRVANSLVLLSRAKLGDVNGGGGTGGISCFCCVDGCASRPACPPKRVCLACFSPLFSLLPLPLSSLPIAHPLCTRSWPSCTCRTVVLCEVVLPIAFCATHCFLSHCFLSSATRPCDSSAFHLPSCRPSLHSFALLLFGHPLVCTPLPLFWAVH